jgi:hypothetical protein
MYLTGPDRGVIDVSIDDGKYVDTIDAHTLMNSQATWISPVWDMGVHTVRFEIAGRGWIDMDAIQVFEPDRIPPGDVTSFTAATGTAEGSVNLNWIAPADDAGNNASGPVASYLVKYSTAPIAGLPTPVTPGNPQAMTVSGLNPGTLYYFAIRAQDEQANLSVNFATANATAKSGSTLGPGIYDDTNPAWSYMGSWLTTSDSLFYDGTLHYSITQGDYATTTIHGTAFTLYYTQYPTRGRLNVYVDNIQIGTITQTGSAIYQMTWTSPNLGMGDHFLKFVYLDGTSVDIDAIQVLP